eukprot:scaffold115670_cov20-Tisochrysis_lutea.AAC.1
MAFSQLAAGGLTAQPAKQRNIHNIRKKEMHKIPVFLKKMMNVFNKQSGWNQRGALPTSIKETETHQEPYIPPVRLKNKE